MADASEPMFSREFVFVCIHREHGTLNTVNYHANTHTHARMYNTDTDNS